MALGVSSNSRILGGGGVGWGEGGGDHDDFANVQESLPRSTIPGQLCVIPDPHSLNNPLPISPVRMRGGRTSGSTQNKIGGKHGS